MPQRKDESSVLKPSHSTPFLPRSVAGSFIPSSSLDKILTDSDVSATSDNSLDDVNLSRSACSIGKTSTGKITGSQTISIGSILSERGIDTIAIGNNQPMPHSSSMETDRKGLPVYLQRVSYQPMSHDLPTRNQVSATTKDMLANKLNAKPFAHVKPMQQPTTLSALPQQGTCGTNALAHSTQRPLRLLGPFNKAQIPRSMLLAGYPFTNCVRLNGKNLAFSYCNQLSKCLY